MAVLCWNIIIEVGTRGWYSKSDYGKMNSSVFHGINEKKIILGKKPENRPGKSVKFIVSKA